MSYMHGKFRANMQFFKLATDHANEKSAVILNTEGDFGAYNRANISVHHTVQNCPPFIATLQLSFFLFPLPSFVLLCVFCFARIVEQIG